jgi:phosphatidylserine synthase 2
VTRTLRYLVVVGGGVVSILLFLLATASDNSGFFDRYYSWLLGLNAAVAVALSALFELCEYSFEYLQPNFAECWWDHWLLDFALCNGVGLWLGMLTVRWLNAEPFDWTGTERTEPLPRDPLSQLALVVRQFAPYEFARYEWRLFERFSNFAAVCLLVGLMEVIELNAFVLKFVLYLEPGHPLNLWRLAFWFFMSLPATHEYYDYIRQTTARAEDRQQRQRQQQQQQQQQHVRVGPNLWLAVTLALAETLVSLKYAEHTRFAFGLPSERALWRYVPAAVYACWAVALGALGAWTAAGT